MAAAFELTAGLWEPLRGGRVFLTGGTGFLGRWLVETFRRADAALALGAELVVLSRQPDGGPLAGLSGVSVHRGDVRDFEFPPGSFSHVIHAAASAAPAARLEEPRDVVVGGTSRALRLAAERGARGFLLVSSGAVYDRASPPPFDEDAPKGGAGADAYARAKLEAESLCLSGTAGPRACAARGFSFIGPGMPLDAGFAAGSFIRDALGQGPITVTGDGSALRSYLYASDMAAWLWTILLKGAAGRAYNVGSERAVSVLELARAAAAAARPSAEIRVLGAAAPADRYVPSTRRAREELGLRETVSLEEGLRRCAAWASAAACAKRPG